LAEQLIIDGWVNCDPNFNLDLNDSKIKIIHVFQMLCPGCIYHGIPQTTELYNKFNSDKVVVVGLHSVFEDHDDMIPELLEDFIKEFELPFPIAIDKRLEGEWMPETMKLYQFQGTPSTLIIDQSGNVKIIFFGVLESNKIEAIIQQLIEEKN